MILEMKVPSPGESITEVEIADWLVQDGDYVEKDQAIAEVDSDKATLELPAEASGKITLQAEVGDAVAVGAVVAEKEGEQNDGDEGLDKSQGLGASRGLGKSGRSRKSLRASLKSVTIVQGGPTTMFFKFK